MKKLASRHPLVANLLLFLFSLSVFLTDAFLAPAVVSAAAAQPSPIDFVQNQIWFSKQSFSGGEQVKIYTSVFNGSTADTRGAVEFYDNQTLLGTAQFSATAGGSQIVSIRWVATAGEHLFRAKITSIRATYPDGREENLPDIATGSTVSMSVAAPVPSATAASAASVAAQFGSMSGILRSLDTGPITATSTLPQRFIHTSVGIASSTDALLDRAHATLEAAKFANGKKLAAKKLAPAKPVGTVSGTSQYLAAASASGDGSVIATPFRILYSYVLTFLTYLFAHKIILYLLGTYVLYKIIRLSVRRFFRPAV